MVTLVAYVAGAVLFMALDYFQRPHFLYKYKINPGKNAPPPLKKVIKVGKYEDHKVWQDMLIVSVRPETFLIMHNSLIK